MALRSNSVKEKLMKIDFEFTTKFGVFRDALHLPDGHTFSDTDIQAMKQERLNNWLAIVDAPPAEETQG